MMSVIKTTPKPAIQPRRVKERTGALPQEFTVRDMNRNTAKVLAAARKYGRVTIRSRGGERFMVEPATAVENGIGPQPDFRERIRRHRDRMKALGYTPPTEEGWAAISRAIAGER